MQSLGVDHLYLFGSTARDEATQASDVDLFSDYRRGELSLLGRKVDITTRVGLHPVLRGGIEAGAVRVF